MIPGFDHNGVLPPFLHGDPTHRGNVSPYRSDILEFAQTFATSEDRKKILEGLLTYREWLRSVAQIQQAFQWFGGSFVEDCEKTRSRPPADLDVVTFYIRPPAFPTAKDWHDFFLANKDYFDPDWLTANMKCDAYMVNAGVNPFWTIRITHYWFGLLSHQRTSRLWKGLLEVDLWSNDSDANAFLSGLVFS